MPEGNGPWPDHRPPEESELDETPENGDQEQDQEESEEGDEEEAL